MGLEVRIVVELGRNNYKMYIAKNHTINCFCIFLTHHCGKVISLKLNDGLAIVVSFLVTPIPESLVLSRKWLLVLVLVLISSSWVG